MDTNGKEKATSSPRPDSNSATSSSTSPLTQQQRGQLKDAESDILLHETTLKSLNGELSNLSRQVAAEKANVLRRRTTIERLERRSADLRASREESAALVRSVEQTLKKTMNRLKRRLGDLGGGGGGDDEKDTDTTMADETASDGAEKSQVVVDEAAALLQKVDGELVGDNEDENGVDQEVAVSDASSGPTDAVPPAGGPAVISAHIVPFHQNQELVLKMWSKGKDDPSNSLQRVSHDNAIGGEEPDHTGDAGSSMSNFGGQSTAMLPYLLPPISTRKLYEGLFAILSAEPTAAKKLLKADDDHDGSQLAAFVQSFLRGTCLDPLANAGYDIITVNEVRTENINQRDGSQKQSEKREIDPTVALCPYELGGQCADDTCPYQHLEERSRGTGSGANALIAALQCLQSLPLPLPPLSDERNLSRDDLERLSSERCKRRRLDLDSPVTAPAPAADKPEKISGREKREENNGDHPNSKVMETNDWDGQMELDFVSLPKGEIEAEDDDGNDKVTASWKKPDAITDAGALSSSSEDEEDSERDENGSGSSVVEDTENLSISVQRLFWHSPSEDAACIGKAGKSERYSKIAASLQNEGRGSVGLDDLLFRMGFIVEAGTNPCLKYGAPYSSDVDGPARAVAAVMDAIRLCVHSGRYELGYGLLGIAKEVTTSAEDECLSSALVHAAEFIDEAAMCCTQTHGSNMFNVQVSFAILAQFLRCYHNHRDCPSDINWKKLEVDCFYIQDDASASLAGNFSHLCRSSGGSHDLKRGAETDEDVTVQEALWVQRLRSSLKNALASIDSATNSSPDTSTRQLISYATVGNELASLLVDATAKEESCGGTSFHSMSHLILDPVWDVIRCYLVKLTKANGTGGQVDLLCPLNPSVVGCCLLGPMLFASSTVFFSRTLAEHGNNQSTLDLDPKSKGTLTTISNFLNKVVRSLRRINEETSSGNERDGGSLIAGDVVIAPLYSLCISVTSALSSFGQLKILFEEAFSLSAGTKTGSTNPRRTCLVLSELLWSQYMYSNALSQLATGLTAEGDNCSGSDLAMRLLQYGIHLRQMTLRGDAALVRQAVNGDKQALSVCKQIVGAAFFPDNLGWVENGSIDDMDRVKLKGRLVSSSKTIWREFPTSLLLMRNLQELSFTGHGVKTLPASLGFFYSFLEVYFCARISLTLLLLLVEYFIFSHLFTYLFESASITWP